MIIIGIETSCDDTCISVMKIKNPEKKYRADFEILSSVVSSQVKLHAKYGGVYPTLAKREHLKNLDLVFKQAIKEAKDNNENKKFKVDLIAVTVGPGLEPCLWTGINYSEKLSEKLKAPIIPVNHIEAHVLANWLEPIQKEGIKLPAICLIVSGGHTQLVLMKSFNRYQILGETRDDAAGECFDKTARILGLGYPGGPIISRLADQKSKKKMIIALPRPMIYQKNYDFSFSGLKTAVLYDYRKRSARTKKSKAYIKAMAKEIQQSIIDVLISKTIRAIKEYKVKSVILGGGVAANQELRKQLERTIEKESPEIKFFAPSLNLSTDNAAMTALTGYYESLRKKGWKKIKANANLKIGRPYE